MQTVDMNTGPNLDRNMALLTEREGELANRAAGLTLLALLLAVIAMVAIPVTFRETERADLRALSAAPLAAAVGVAALAYSARHNLETVRSRKVELSSETEPVPDRGTEPPETA